MSRYQLQVSRLRRRHGIPEPTARAVAFLAYGEGRR